MVRRVVDRVSGMSDESIVVVARNASRTDYVKVLPGFARVINDEPEGKGPIVGIVTGLKTMESQYAIVLSCDIPFVNKDVIQLLLERSSGADAVIPRSKTGHLEPLQAIYRREPVLRRAEEALLRRELSPTSVIFKLAKVVYVSIEDEIRAIDPELRTFFNVNTREDVAKAEAMLMEGDEA